MTDMLVKLYDLPPLDACLENITSKGCTVRRAMAYEKTAVLDWLGSIAPHWVDECAAGFSHAPHKCFIATENGAVVGFAVYDVVIKNMFGPTLVDDRMRGKGLGTGLMLSCMHSMRNDGYGYAIIGGVGPKEYYAKTVGAVEIAGSTPGVYIDRLNQKKS